jgi:hypothetical protein
MTTNLKSRPSSERGSALVEFVLCFGLFWVPLFLGTLVIGFNLIRAVQVTQVCRDAGHMYSFGIDFSQTGYKNLLASLAPGLSVDPAGTGGRGVVILSTVTYVDATQCQAGGYSSTCPNQGQIVFTRRIVVGKTSLHTSAFGTPNSSLVDSSGNVRAGSNSGTSGYLNDSSAIATGFSNVLSLTSGQQYAYVSEMFVQSNDYNWWSFLGPIRLSARSIF